MELDKTAASQTSIRVNVNLNVNVNVSQAPFTNSPESILKARYKLQIRLKIIKFINIYIGDISIWLADEIQR